MHPGRDRRKTVRYCQPDPGADHAKAPCGSCAGETGQADLRSRSGRGGHRGRPVRLCHGSRCRAQVARLRLYREHERGGKGPDADGTVHYFGEDGREELVLSAEEAAAYQQQQIAAHDRAVCQSTTLVDVSTMPFIPNSVTELAVDADGHFAEFAFGNAHMVLLYPENSTGFDLRTGDTVTISLDADARGSLGFGLFKDGIYVSEEVVSAQGHLYTFKIEEDGRYCFFVENCSAGMYICTDGSLTVN